MEEAVSRREHEEFAKRIDAENVRQNHRITMLEQNVENIRNIARGKLNIDN